MHVGELWRYPVKSLKGERLDEVEIRADGLAGDRVVHVRNGSGRVLTSRTKPRLLALQGRLGNDGEPLIDGGPWYAEESRAAVRAAAGEDAELVAYEGPERFDVLPLSIATDGAIARPRRRRSQAAPQHRDRRRRPARRAHLWPGLRLRIGDVLVAVARLLPRCVMTTNDPDTQEQDYSVLPRIVGEFGGALALDCAVIRGGRVRLGDRVELVPHVGA